MGGDIYFQWISKIIKLSSERERERECILALLKILLGLLKVSIKRIRNWSLNEFWDDINKPW